ncbi:restriction endonuclease subunit S [Pseudomonas helleri]|uniref:restriction endonuclease subunit S n=1 Tax=Pseudomonas helleri TaxID=1608996 RepID=UPI0028E7C4F3|nr:restriction endonuclease subunit S [Pseudomonas helleri]
MSFPAYPGYKHSGVELLGEFPGHWTLKRFKNVFGERAERSTDGTEELLSVSAYFGIKPRSETLDEGDHLSRAESLEGYKVCQAGDLVINIMLAWNRGLGFSWQRGIVSPAYCVFYVTDGSVPEFLDYLVRSDECIRYFKTHSAGIMDSRLRLYPDSFGRLFTAIPPACEQTQIARFLDYETGRIDALIEEQQRLIELLKEKRQAVISHAVTKGLDSTVPMKDSGVEWLGDVPAHWEVGGLTRFIGPVVDYRGRTPTKVDDGIFLVTARNIRNGRIDYEASEEYADPESAESLLARGRPEIGDLLFTMEAPLGQVALIDRTDIALAQRIVKFRGEASVMRNHYLMFWFMSKNCQARLETLATGSTALGIKSSKLGMIECLAPTLNEQDAIVSHVQRESEKNDALVYEAENVIGLLQERRSALISAAVTGKIDVRGWQPPASASSPESAQEAV